MTKKEEMTSLKESGWTYRRIGDKFQVSRQRVHQIITNYKSTTDWRKQGREFTRSKVRERDNHTCQVCHKKWNKSMRRFDVHHLNGMCGKMSIKYDKVADLDGLLTLCHKCHYNHPEHSSNIK